MVIVQAKYQRKSGKKMTAFTFGNTNVEILDEKVEQFNNS